jgi:hypothetical protein
MLEIKGRKMPLTEDQIRLMGGDPRTFEARMARMAKMNRGSNAIMAQVNARHNGLEEADDEGDLDEDATPAQIAAEAMRHLQAFLEDTEGANADAHLATAGALIAMARVQAPSSASPQRAARRA